MNVLLSSVSRKVSLARTWYAACHGHGGALIVADMNPDCAGMYEGDDAVKLPSLDSDSFRPILKSACQKFGVKLVVPTRDEEVLAFSEWQGEFAALGIRMLTPSLETVRLCRDKILFTDWCEKHGFGVPKTYGPHDLSFPAFLRYRYGRGSSSAVRVRNFDEFKRTLMTFGAADTLIQEYIRVPEYSVDVFASQDGTVISAIPRLRKQIVSGESWVTVTVKHTQLQAEAVKLAHGLKLTGHAVMQCFVEGDKVMWIEVNPRFGGASACAFEAGCNSPEWLMDESKCPKPLAPYEADLTMLRYSTDRFVRKG
jgi:carbamoyl-phosphate synthase large subunit